MEDLSVRPGGLEVLWGNREPQKDEEQLGEVPTVYFNNIPLHRSWQGTASLPAPAA